MESWSGEWAVGSGTHELFGKCLINRVLNFKLQNDYYTIDQRWGRWTLDIGYRTVSAYWT